MKFVSLLFLFWVFNRPDLCSQSLALEQLTIEDGLSQGMIYDVLQTRDGFLWIATKDGLNRYDGYNFKTWSHHADNPFSLADNTVTALFEDSKSRLWIGTSGEGVQLFDRKNDRFYHFHLPVVYNKGNQVPYDILQFEEDPGGNIWIVNRGGGVFRMGIPDAWNHALPDHPELGSLTTLTLVPIPASPISEPGAIEEFRTILTAQDGSIWIGSSQNIYQVDPQSLAINAIKRPTGFPRGVWRLKQLASGEIWGTGNTGVFRYQNGAFTYFPFSVNGPTAETYPALSIGNDGQLWILFEKKLWRFSNNDNFHLQEPNYRADKAGNVLYQDDQDNIWIGTLGYGLRKLNLRKSQFQAMLEGVSIWGIWQTKATGLLCKLFTKIVKYDPVSCKLSEQSAFPDALPQQNDLIFGPDGEHWLLCGLREGSINKSEIRHYKADGSLLNTYEIKIGRYPYARLMRTHDGAIWASGAYGKLLRIEPETGKQTIFDFGYLFGENVETLITYALAEDGKGQIWAGTQLGLVKARLQGDQMDFRLITSDGPKGKALNNNSIACILPDPKYPEHLLWIGTKGSGINCLDLRTESFSYITTEQGLPNNVVYGILPDHSGHLWCSTNRGLAKLTFKGSSLDQITPITVGDGLQSDEFNTQAFFRTTEGELLFGGVNGINRFVPERLQFNTSLPQVYVIELYVNQSPLRLAHGSNVWQPVEYQPQIQLDYTQNNLSFEFAAMDFTDPQKNQYRYRLMPIEKNWMSTRKDHFAHYTHLAPGRYVFSVQGCNSAGIWNEKPVEMVIIIHPPWWNSSLAYLIYILAFALTAWQAWRLQVNRVKIREQLAYEQRETERIKALEQVKTNFFSNITHEFRTPLSLMLEPARRILAQSKDPDIVENARHIESNSFRLLHMVNQLLQLAKLESGAMHLDLRHGDFAGHIREIFRSFLPLAEQRGIQLSLKLDGPMPPFVFDTNKTELIVNNLLSNALKFTPAGGTVWLYLSMETTTPPDGKPASFAVVQVRDTGIGIPAESFDKIFNRYYQVEGPHTQAGEGTGIGLALSKELAELMGGTISVTSNGPSAESPGSTFTFRLPRKTALALSDHLTAVHIAETTGTTEETIPPRNTETQAVVLVIEDSAALRRFIKQSLHSYWQVVEASNGKEGIKKAIELVPDLIISDLMMPEMDGYAVCDTLKNTELTAHIPVILLTAKTDLDAKLKGLRSGADDYLTKPFHTEELLVRMENLLEIRRKLKQLSRQVDTGTTAAHAPGTNPFLSELDQDFLRRFSLLLEQNLANENLGIEDFAQKMFISRSQLHRKLTALTDQNATDFIRDYRLDRAMEMLKNKEGMVNEIAGRVGFANEKYFSTAFKAKFGVSPSRV